MPGKIGIIGSGLIGRSWSMIFASQAYDVYLYDVVPEAVDKALVLLKDQLETLEKSGLLRGDLTAAQQFSHVHKAAKLEEAVEGAVHVQECVFENLELKQKVFQELDSLPATSTEVVLCSSTSCFLPSLVAAKMSERHRAQFIVGHPVNPPYFVPLVEIIPSPWTKPSVLERTRRLLTAVGQKPVVLKREIEGFIVNRVQYAILNECYRLIADDVISVEDVDTVMSEGLGMRYAFMGPWETAHLNAAGMEEYFEKYSKGIYDVSATMGPPPKMEGATARLITEELTRAIPVEKLEERRKWRDQRLIALSQLKKKMAE